MAEASEVRDMQQEDLLNGMIRDARSAAPDDDHDAFFLSLAAALAGNLVIRRRMARDGEIPFQLHFGLGTDDQLAQSHAGRFAKVIEEFSRMPEEEANLLGRLLVKFTALGLSGINAAYLNRMIHEPQVLYGGHKGTDQVSFFPKA